LLRLHLIAWQEASDDNLAIRSNDIQLRLAWDTYTTTRLLVANKCKMIAQCVNRIIYFYLFSQNVTIIARCSERIVGF
jgi:hypothetical protein